MANTISTTIAINDNMSKALQSMNSSASALIKNLERMETVASKVETVAGKFSETQAEIEKTREAVRGLGDDAGKTTSLLSKIGSGVKSVGGAIGKGLAVAGGAAAAGISAAVGGAVSQYADYEQLVGGVDTLFKDSSATVQRYARDAFQTAGLSANAYMETVTGFSASMIQSLGGDTAQAAELSNQALIDMSDNANKMGTDMESIQNAYQGFAKRNYEMLDNLKLGYGGTQEEMQRLLSDAEKLTGQKYDITSFADVTQAIHAIQTEMGITGTTAKEASTTISGSFNAVKAAGMNVFADLVNGGANLNNSINALVESAATFGNNIIPAVEKALSGLNTLIEGIAPVIGEVLPQLVSTLLPLLTSSVVTLLQTLVSSIAANAPQLSQALITALFTAIQGLATLLPEVMNAAQQILLGLMQGLTAAAPQLISSAVMMMDTLVNGLISNLPMLVMAALNLIMALVSGLISNLPQMIQSAVSLITGLIQGIATMLPQIIQMGIQLVFQLAVGLIQAIPYLIAAVPQLISAIWDGIASINWLDLGIQVVKGIWDGIKSLAGAVWDAIKSIFTGGSDTGAIDTAAVNAGSTYTSSLNSSLSSANVNTTAISAGLNADFSVQGTASAVTWNTGFSTGMAASATQAAESCTGVTSTFGQMNADIENITSTTSQGMLDTVKTTGNDVMSTTQDMANNIETTMKNVDLKGIGANMIQGLVNGINSKKTAAVNAAREIANAINREFEKIEDINSPSKVWRKYGSYLVEGLTIGIADTVPKGKQSAEGLAERYSPDFIALRRATNGQNNSTTIHAPVTIRIANTNEFKSDADISLFTRRLANSIAQQIGMQLEGVTV